MTAGALLTLAWLIWTGPAQAAPAPAVDSGERVYRLFPPRDLYPPYLADLHRPGFGLVQHSVSSVGVAGSGDSRFDLRLGGRFGVLRSSPPGEPDRGWQLAIVAGFDGQFDIESSYDNVGWDGNYGLSFSYARGRGLAFRASLFHTSSHVGDEYAERTGRRRIGYTREELTAGVSWQVRPRWRAYVEGGWGYSLRNEELQEPARAQLGVEHVADASLWKGRLGWFAALDLSATEERDWTVDVSLQLGVTVPSGDRRWRAGLGFYDGRVPLGEFFQDDETYVTLGLWLDLH